MSSMFFCPSNKDVDNALFEFLRGCNGDDYKNEKELENALMEYLCKTKKYHAKSQVACDGQDTLEKNPSVKEFAQAGEQVIDVVVKTIDGYYPIELKFEENSESQLNEDKAKIAFYKKHYADINDGCVLLLTSKDNCPWKKFLKESPQNEKYSYVLMGVGETTKEEPAISFKERWDTKK